MLEKGFTVPELLEPSLPAAVSWFPLPAGWAYLGASVILVLIVFLLIRVARWRRNQWRRDAHNVLQQTDTVDKTFALIKRVLLVHQPRDRVSQDISPAVLLQSVPLDEDLRQTLAARYCQPDNHLEENQRERVRVQLMRWLGGLPDV